MSNYAWTITKDYIADPKDTEGSYSNAKGLTGPSDAPQALLDRLAKGEGLRFRMKDDDMETYYDGRILIEPEEGEEEITAADLEAREIEGWRVPILHGPLGEEAFGPLEDFGTPNAGAAHIFYFDKDGRLGAL